MIGPLKNTIPTLALLAALGVVGSGAGCGGPDAERAGAIDKLPPQVLDTSDISEPLAPLPGVGARCSGGVCACREVDAAGRGTPEVDVETAPVPAGYKRFELRTGRGDDTMRITIEGLGTFEKSGPLPEAKCIYVDLPSKGAYRVRYHVIAANPSQGAEPRLRISEYSPDFKRWYRTFAFRCTDGSEPCTKDLARDTFQILTKTTTGKFDPCGSTKAQGLRFWTDKGADAAVSDFNLQVVLNVYGFAPRFAPDTKTCKGLRVTKAPAKAVDEGEMTVAPAAPAAPPAAQ